MSDIKELEENEVGQVVELVDDRAPSDDEMDEDVDVSEQVEEEQIVLDLSNNSWTYLEHGDSVFVVERHPKLPLVVSGSADHTAKLWTTHKQPPVVVTTIDHKESVITAKFTADGNYVITADMAGLLQVHRTKNGEKWTKVGDVEEVEEIHWIATHPSQNYFAFGANDGSVWVYQIEGNDLTQLMTGFSHTLDCNAGVFLEDEETIQLVTASDDATVVCWNAITGQPIYKLAPIDFKGIESPWVVLSAQGHMVAVGGRDGQLAIINHQTHKVVNTLQVINNDDHDSLSIEALAWCESMPLLAVGVVHGDVFLFETQQWRLRKSWSTEAHEDYENAITQLQFEPKSHVLVGSSTNGKVYRWDARSGTEMFVGVGHNMPVFDFAIMDDGKLITAGDEGVCLVFNPREQATQSQ
ncbi:hypothetical protein DIURU_004711 [Diutina rugosa]|uniref:Anaphase-promoting complex subunit 4-like WD40 domain-containing protein n=1 Tax=Diutina rugosa TaxID=5481 RepID=A0A642UG93_DIURU|nr:uncharacterized protein DIURU_004711 [Diutina rugosa]KAA8898331.1 hypothetical protein DIURU_004711 [Diutina rugosa]